VVRYDVRGFGQSARDETTEYTHAVDLWQLADRLQLVGQRGEPRGE
jgi:hypothetical protein